MSDDELFEVEELQRAADWRLRKVDADPGDAQSAAAARLLDKLAAEVRELAGLPLYREYMAICNWLSESDGIADFMVLADDYRRRIGVDRLPARGEDYLQAMIELAKRAFGSV